MTQPLDRFSKLGCSATTMFPCPNDTLLDIYRRDISYAALLATGTLLSVERGVIKLFETRSRGGVCGSFSVYVYLRPRL